MPSRLLPLPQRTGADGGAISYSTKLRRIRRPIEQLRLTSQNRSASAAGGHWRFVAARFAGSDIVIKEKLVRHGAQPHLIELALLLVFNPGRDDVFGEDVAAQQELVVFLERGERLFERARHVRHLRE